MMPPPWDALTKGDWLLLALVAYCLQLVLGMQVMR